MHIQKKQIKITKCDFSNPDHCQAEIDLMHAYMIDKMGNHPPLSDVQNKELIKGLENLPGALVLLAVCCNKYVGLTNSFINFSTFAVKHFVNIHDVIVLKEYRGLGIGKKLIEENIRIAKDELHCTKLTLEVREDNLNAQGLYKSYGFGPPEPNMYYWTKYL